MGTYLPELTKITGCFFKGFLITVFEDLDEMGAFFNLSTPFPANLNHAYIAQPVVKKLSKIKADSSLKRGLIYRHNRTQVLEGSCLKCDDCFSYPSLGLRC